MLKPFWKFKAKSDAPSVGELFLYGDISSTTWYGDEVTPNVFSQDLKNLGDISVLNIYINSGGGDVFAGLAIYSILKRHPAQKHVFIDGLAASIASVIAMAGDVVYMPKNAMLMIHKAWTMAIGNANDLRKLADDMDKIDESILTTYQTKTGLESEKIIEMVNAETWLTAEEAVELGFADKIEESKQIAASIDKDFLIMNGLSFDLSKFRNPPKLALTKPLSGVSNHGKTLNVDNNQFNNLENTSLNQQINQVPNNQAVASEEAEPLPSYFPEVQNAGRMLSSSNEALIRQAMDCLSEVLTQLDTSDNGGTADKTDLAGDIGDGKSDASSFDISLYQAQLNLTRRRLDYGF